jgi:hypothetical protein
MTFEEFKTTVRAELILAGLVEIDKLPKIETLETMYKGKLTIKESATMLLNDDYNGREDENQGLGDTSNDTVSIF